MAQLGRLWQHMRGLWPRYTLLPPLPFFLVAIWAALRGDLRWDHLGVAIFVFAMAYFNQATKRMVVGLYPIGLVALLYDSMKLVKNFGVTPERVHLCDLRAAEVRWFGIDLGGTRTTVHDWLQPHATVALDLLSSIPYGTFIFVAMGTAVYLYFKDFSAMQRFMWAFLAMNVLGFVTYHLYPAAPPWYYHTHGCSVDLSSGASEGPNLARVDQLLGVHYFGGMYGRSSDVFGAVPSLHVAYPLLVVFEAWRHFRWPFRLAAIGYFLLMCFAAVYLDHHWIIDVIIGIIYCLFVAGATRAVQRWRRPGFRLGLTLPRGEVGFEPESRG